MGVKQMDFTNFNNNTFKKIEWTKKTDGFSFKKIKDLYSEGNRTVKVYGFFFTKSENYGLQPNAILDDCILNLPTHLRNTISKMLESDDCVNAIKRGECSIRFREYMSKYNKMCYTVDFINTPTTDEEIEPLFS